jgi:hypothetical protein
MSNVKKQPMFSLCHTKDNRTFKITIRFIVNHY